MPESAYVYDRGAKRWKLRGGAEPIRIGQRWDFVGLDGRRREYIVESTDSDELGPAANVRLRNLATGGIARVTHKWLFDGPMEGRMSWVRAEEARAAA